jgi:hypothetical protein
MLEPLTPDTVAAGLDVLAAFHAATWDNAGLEQSDWLTLGSPAMRSITRDILSEESWAHHVALPRGKGIPESQLDRERVAAGFEQMWRNDDASVVALGHGDPHIGNVYLDPSPAFLDWQGVCRQPWSDDVAYFLSGTLTVEDRRANERDLLTHYLAELTARGVTAPSFDEAWLDYRRHQLHGFVWLVVPIAMQPEEHAAVLSERYAIACEDHDTFKALGV